MGIYWQVCPICVIFLRFLDQNRSFVNQKSWKNYPNLVVLGFVIWQSRANRVTQVTRN